MRIFVTGATGFIGSAVVHELLVAGHQVLGLARNDAAVDTLTKMGVEAHRGDLKHPESLAAGASACDGAIHLAFGADFSDIAETFKLDLLAINAMGDALAGSNRPFVVPTGTMVLKPGQLGTENDAGDPASAAGFRVNSENAALAWASKGVRASIVRLAPAVHGENDKHGFIPTLISTAREKGLSAYVGEGQNLWPAVHRLDAARVFRLALENGTAGLKYHAVGEEGIAVRSIAEAIGRQLKVPVVSQSTEAAAEHFGWFSSIIATDNPTSNALTQQSLGWQPRQTGLLADLREAHYFRSSR